ncbi:MAG: efflux RND transporter periplasmic adaptor subunit, partial [Pseudorhodoplanes sp.]|nr:efflux RND transporter periplasmic adaptor subunit [Pseudorhodoplanes sp.]
IFNSPDEQGRVETMMVREGDRVEKDTPLFTLDSDLQRADLAVAQAAVTNTRQAFDRAQQLLKVASGTQRDFDVAQAAYRQADAQLGAAQTRLGRRKLASPIAGVIQQIYFRPGETVPPSRPIIAVLPPGNIKVRFFVPERMLARIAIGDEVRVTCDGCPNNITAPVTFISRNAEFTPPVIFSLEERSKLVYLVEARPAQTDMLRVGQPVSVEVKLHEVPRGTSK